jgi:CRP-like cAMP-binding protein
VPATSDSADGHLTTIERVAALHRVDLFATVPGRVLAAVARTLTETIVPAGGPVITAGALEDHLFVIVGGRVGVHDGEYPLGELGPGTTVGELAALVPEPRSVSVTAREDTRLLRLDKPVLDELLADRPELAQGVIAALVTRLRARRAPTAEAGAVARPS